MSHTAQTAHRPGRNIQVQIELCSLLSAAITSTKGQHAFDPGSSFQDDGCFTAVDDPDVRCDAPPGFSVNTCLRLVALATCVLTGASVSGCSEIATLSVSHSTALRPELPAPNKTLAPTANIATATGGSQRAMPLGAAGMQLMAFASGPAHPRWLLESPSSDLLFTESNAPPRPEGSMGSSDVTAPFVSRDGAGTPGAAKRSRAPLAGLPSRGAEIGADIAVSPQVRQLADWIALTGDHVDAPFILVDKKLAAVFVFDANVRLRAHSAVLLGSAIGDESVPGIGTRPMAQILPAERTTPSGRFVAERGRNAAGEDIVWVDYESAISIHRVRTGNPVERRAERLATPAIDDNRISFGCINVPVAFYDEFIQPIFSQRKAIVYVLPDTKPVADVFGISHMAAKGSESSSSELAHVQDGNHTRLHR